LGLDILRQHSVYWLWRGGRAVLVGRQASRWLNVRRTTNKPRRWATVAGVISVVTRRRGIAH